MVSAAGTSLRARMARLGLDRKRVMEITGLGATMLTYMLNGTKPVSVRVWHVLDEYEGRKVAEITAAAMRAALAGRGLNSGDLATGFEVPEDLVIEICDKLEAEGVFRG